MKPYLNSLIAHRFGYSPDTKIVPACRLLLQKVIRTHSHLTALQALRSRPPPHFSWVCVVTAHPAPVPSLDPFSLFPTWPQEEPRAHTRLLPPPRGTRLFPAVLPHSASWLASSAQHLAPFPSLRESKPTSRAHAPPHTCQHTVLASPPAPWTHPPRYQLLTSPQVEAAGTRVLGPRSHTSQSGAPTPVQ